MPINIQDYLLGRIPVGRKIDIPAYLMAKAAGGKIQEITGTLPLYVRSRASQILKNYIIYGTASGAGVETENLWNENYENISTDLTYKSINVGNGQFTLSTNTPLGTGGSSLLLMPGQQSSGATTVNNGAYYGSPRTVTSVDGYVTLVYRIYDNKDPRDYQTMLTKGTTAPSSYIPHGYKLPITVTSNGTTTDYPIYIGDSQLMEGEYVDYEEQKIYKLVDGVLTPIDPPVPLPDITLPQGEVTIDIEGDPKPQATVKGKIEQI
jgi:hypothetical protein